MTTIHAFMRTKPVSVELFDTVVEFQPNAKGHVVAEVSETRVSRHLLSIKEGYRVYGSVPIAAAEEEEIETSPYVLTQEGDDGNEITVDLRMLNREALVVFCAENEIPKPHPNSKEETIRDAIVAFFKVE